MYPIVKPVASRLLLVNRLGGTTVFVGRSARTDSFEA